MPHLEPMVEKLAAAHGEPDDPTPTDPWHHALWIACAYLVDDDRRLATFLSLESAVGLAPRELLGAPRAVLEQAIAGGGMKPPMRADKLISAAQTAIDAGVAEPGALARMDPVDAKRVLRRFPGVSAVVAERILVRAGRASGLPVESNGLRVLLRLGFGEPLGRYGESLAAAVGAVPDPPETAEESWRALALLRTHGQQICKGSNPRCQACALEPGCPSSTAR